MIFNRYYTKLARGEWETVLGVHGTKKLADAQTLELNTRYQTNEYYTEKHDEEKFKRENLSEKEVLELLSDFRKNQDVNPNVDTMTFVCYSCKESMTVQNKGLGRSRGYAWLTYHQGHTRDYFVDKHPRKVVD